MGVKELIEEKFQEGVELGSDTSISPGEAVSKVMENAKKEFEAADSLKKSNKERKMAIAKRINQLREETEYRQKDVAARIGINVITLSGYEIGKSEPPEEVLVRLAGLYGVSLDYLMCRTDTRIEFDDGEYRAIDADRRKLQERLDNIEKELTNIRQGVK